MKTPIIRKSMNWLSQHWEMVIGLGGLAVSQLASYLKLRFEVTALKEKTKDQEIVIDAHVASPTLHRTPDFENNLIAINSRLDKVDTKLDRVLERLPSR